MAIDTYLPTPDQLRNIIQQRTSGLPEYTEPTPNLPQGMTDYAQHNRAFHNFNNDPLQSKRDEVERATVRKQQQMGLLNREAQEEDTRLIASGATPEQLQAHQDRRNYLQSLDEGTRLNLFLQGNDDPYLGRDLNSMTANQLSVKYGKRVADYANQLSLDRMALTQQANYRFNRDDTTPTADLIQNMGGSAVEGIGNIASGLANAGAIVYDKVTGDTEGAINYIQSEGAGAAISQLGRDIQSDDMALARKRNEATDQILEQNKERRALELSEEMTPDNARSKANLEQDLNQINAYFGRNTNAADVAQQVPELLATAATGGGFALATRGTLALAKQGVNKLTKEAAEQIIKASATAGISTYTGLREGEGGYRTAFDDVMSMDPTEVANSPEGQKLKQQDSTLTDTQIQREIASRAGNLAFNTTGALGAGIGLLAPRAELSFAGLNPISSVKQAIKGYGKDVGSEVAEEGSQGIASTVAPRLAINEALGYEKYRSESGDLTQGAIYSAFEGAATAAGSTSVTNSPNVIKTTGKAVSQGLQQGYEAVKQKGKTVSENMTGKKASEEMEDLYSPKTEPTESSKSTGSNTDTDSGSESKPNNLYGFTTNYKDSKLNQAFDNLDTELKSQLGEDSPIYKKLGSNQNAKLDALKSIAESAYETSQNPNATDEQKTLAQTQMNTYDDIITSLREGYNADLTARRESINKREEELFSVFHKMRNEFVQSKPEEYESFMSDLIKQAQGQELNIDDIAVELVRKYDPDMFNAYVELLQVDDAFNRVQEANNSNPILMKINDTLYRNRETVEDKNITLDVSKQTLDVVENQLDLGKSLDHLAKAYADKASKLNPQDSDYRAKKEALDKQFQAMFLKINARKQLQRNSIKQEWGKALDGLGKFRKVLKDNGSTIEQGAISSLFNAIQRIGKRIQDNPRISDAEALTLYEKFIGSNKNKGLLNYMQEAIRNKGILSPNSLNSLHHFVSTQQFKNNLIENLDTFLAEIENTAKKEGKTLGKDFSFTWNNLSSKGKKTKQQGSNEAIRFNNREAFIKYGKRATSDMALFTEVINQILDKPINVSTKQTVKPEVKETVKPEVKQEVKQEIKETIKSKIKPKVEPVQEQKQAKPTVPVNQETTKTEEPVIPVTEPEETRPINVNQAGQFILFDDVYVETNEFGEPLTEEELSSQNVPENQLKLNLGVEPTLKLTNTKASLQVLKNNISRITGLDLDRKTPEVLEVEAEARLRGVSWKENFIENYGVWHANKLIPQDKLQAIYRAQQTKRMTDLDLAIQAVTGKPTTAKDREYFEGYFNIYRTIANRLFGKNQATGTEGGFTDNLYLFTKVNSTATQADRLGNLILRLNPVFNFMNFETNDKGKQKVTVPSELIQAMTNALIGSIVKESSHSANAKQVYEQLRDHDPRPAFLVDTTNHQRLANGNLKTFNEQLMTEGSSLNQSTDWTGSMEGYGSLGSEEQTLIKTMGEAVLENLGLSLNGKHNGEKLSATVKQSIAFGLGSELYDELNNMNVLKKTRMIYFDTVEGEKDKAQLVPANYINFATFHWNNNFESYIPNKKGKTNELLLAEQIPAARKAIQDEYQKLLRSTQRDYSNMDKLSPPYNPNKGFFGDVLKVSLNGSSEASKVILGDTAKESKGISLEPFKANPKNINSMLTTGKNKVALDFLDEFNKIKWAVDVPFYGLLRQAEPVFKTLLGVIDPATYDSTKADKESRMSLTNQINRSFDLAYEHFNEDYENTSLQDKRFYIKHSLVSTQRVRQDSAFNPQNVKLDREILLPVNTIRNEDGTETTHESILKLNKLSGKYKLKTNIEYFVNNVLKDYKNNQADDTALGTVMALAQALGFKIEKQLDQTVLENFKKWVDSDEAKDVMAFAEYVRDVKTDAIDDINGEQYHQLAARLFDQYGNATARLAKVTSTLADIDLMLNGKLNQAHITLVIEMDGIGNGVNNSNRQFSTSFTGHYINTLKRTGNVTMDLIAQSMANGLTIEEIQGSKFIFDRKDKPLDVYEVVSDQMLKDIQGTTEKMIKALKIVTKHLRIKKPLNLMDILQHPEINKIVNDPKAFGVDDNEYAQMVFNQTSFLLKKVRAIILVEAMDSFDSKLDVKTYNLINDFETPIAKKIARGLAKTAVTPTNYGGKLDGITQQAMLNLKATLKAKAKEFYLALKSEDQERIKEAYTKLHTLIIGLGMNTQWTRFLDGKSKTLQLGSPEQFNQMLKTYGKSDEFKEVMTQLAESYSKITPFNGDKVIRNVKYSLGSQLFTSISNVYKEQFENIDTAIQANTLMFRTFLVEYLNKTKYREEQRNKENGWIDDKGNITDVRAYDTLSSSEIKAILQSISSLPIIGTAMSNNEVLVNRLVDYGNTLAKKLKVQTDKNKRSIASSLTSKFIANRDEKAKYVVMTHVVSDLWRGFAEAGASALTSTIVSTESLSQALTARMLNELGLAANNVYDGSEIDIAYRKAVSELINKYNNEAHFETNLLRENFHALNRSGLADFIKYTPEIKRMRDWFESKDTELKGITFDTFLEETNVTPEYLAQYLNTIVYVMGNDKAIKENFGDLYQLMRLFADDVNNTVTKRLMGIEADFNIDMWFLRQAFTNFSMENENPETHLIIKDLFQAKLFGLGSMAAKSEAMKRIEKEYFPMIVNQFGGISSGYIHNNPNENPKVKAVMDRFLAYVEQQNFDIKTHNFAADQFDLLSGFIDQDTELKDKLNTIYRQELKKLNVTRVGSLELSENQTIEKVGDLYNEEFTVQLSQNQRIVLDVLKPLLTTATGLDTKIYRDPIEFAKASGIPESELTNSLGKFVLNNGQKYIYLAEPSEFVDSYTVGLHEIIHSAFDELSAAYFVQTESNPILGSKMTGIMRNLEFLMKDFAKRYHYEVGFRDALNTLVEENQIAQNEAENAEIEDSAEGIGTFKSGNIFANYSDLVAITASIEFAYNPDNGLSPQAAMQAKYTAFNEFLAYALSSQEILTKLQYTGRSGKIPVGVWDSIKKFFNSVKREIQALFGFTNQNKNTAMKDRAPENYLIDILTSVKVLGSVKPAKFEAIRAKLDRYKPTVLSYMKKHLNETEQAIFGYESNQAMDLGDMSEQTSFDAVADNSNISDKHKEYLSALYGLTQHTLRDMLVNQEGIQNYPTEIALLESSQVNQEANDLLIDMQTNGVVFSELERRMFKLAYALNKASFDGQNEKLRIEAERTLNSIIDKIKPEEFLASALANDGAMRFGSIFNNKLAGDNNTAMIMAVVTTNESVKNYIENLMETNRSIGEKIKSRYDSLIMNRKANQFIGNISNKTIIEQLGLVSASLDFRNKLGAKRVIQIQEQQFQEELAKQQAYNQYSQFVDEHIPFSVLRDATKVSLGAMFSGQGYDSKSTDSTLGDVIRDLIESYDYMKGRPTLLSQFVNWILQASSKNQYAYRMRSSYTALSDSIREKLGNVVNAYIEDSFKDLTDDKRKATKLMLRTELHKVNNLRGLYGTNVKQAVADTKYRQQKIKEITDYLESEYVKVFPQDGTAIKNYLVYQTDALAEFSQKGITKSDSVEQAYVLTNTQNIARLQGTGFIGNLDIKELVPYVDALVSLKALNHIGSKDLGLITEMLETEPKATEIIFKEMNHTDKLESETNSMVSGYFGYRHNRWDNNFDVQVVNEQVTTEKEKREVAQEVLTLKLKGYEKVATLANGYSVYHSTQSLTKGYTTGVFNLAEYTYKGANYKTGIPVNSVGLVHKSNYIETDFLAAMRKVMQGTMDYQNHKYVSNTHMVYGMDGVTLFTMPSFEQTEKWIPMMEDDFQSIGNNQARKFEEELSIQSSIQNVKRLNEVYQKRTDKHNFVAIGEVSTLDKKYKDKADKLYRERISGFYKMLPQRVKNEINALPNGILMIEKHQLDNLIGYYQGSIIDPLIGKSSSTPEWFDKLYGNLVSGLLKIEGLPVNPIKALKYSERGLSEVVSFAKENVLIRSLSVPFQNLFSNLIHCVNVGIPLKQIVPLMLEGYQAAKTYINNEKEIIRLNHRLMTENLSTAERNKLEAKSRLLLENNNRNPVKPMMVGGIFTSLSETSDTIQDDSPFSLASRIKRWTKLDRVESATPSIVQNILMTNGSMTHTHMMNIMNYGDFVAKYAYYQHLTRNLQRDSEHAMDIIRDEFVNYNMNRGKVFDMLNKLGIFWFTSYILGIQKVIYRNARRNFLRTALIFSAGSQVNKYGIDTVPNQAIGLDYSFYHTDPTNLPGALGSHWLWSLLKN